MKQFILFSLALFLPFFGFSQTILPLTDNMDIASNSNIKIQPGSYTFSDIPADGVIRIVGKDNITIDGDSVEVNGVAFGGYFINIENSSHITIKNFKSVSTYRYAISVKQSSQIYITENNLSYNQKDTVGWISIYTDQEEALGGGVLMYQCYDSELYKNTMVQQNDGVALYDCDAIYVHDNLLNWNCGFGIRMYFTNHCTIRRNDCSHVNRITDPSDCAAILVIASGNNIVESNDFTYSGDGIFLSNWNHSDIPGNNIFRYNDCSYSPHNAIEATFADGNTFEWNRCNFSHYGFWLGYSFNSKIKDNEIVGNLNSGIAIDRGYNDSIHSNLIKGNPYGIELWEGSGVVNYTQQFSHDYYITDNLIEGNIWGISAIKTEHLIARNNTFYRNKEDIYLEGQSNADTITGNTFKSPTLYHIHSISTDPVMATRNIFVPMIDSMINKRVSETVNWLPYTRGDRPKIQTTPPCDMAERPAVWTIYADPGYGLRCDETLEFDYTDRKVGASSVKMYTPRGWDVGLNYRPGEDSMAVWNLSESDTLSFWIKTIKQPLDGFQAFHIRVGNSSQGYYEYTGQTSLLNNAHNTWKRYRIPLKGNSSFVRASVGDMTLNNVNYVEFRADTWDFGYTLWLDGVQFRSCNPTGIDEDEIIRTFQSGCYPNPFKEETTIWFEMPEAGRVRLSVFDLQGREISSLVDEELTAGRHEASFSRGDLASGIYYYRLYTAKRLGTGKLVIE